MNYGQRYVIRWTPRLKRKIILCLITIFIIGGIFGFTICKVFATSKKETVYTPMTDNTQSSGSITTIPIKSAVLVKEPTVEATEPQPIYYDCPLSNDLQDYIRELCSDKDVPMSLVIAMIEVESSFRANIISKSDDYGLMQINKINHKVMSEEYGVTDFLDPYQNVFCGITIIAEHLEKTDGDIALALMRYNCGATGAKRLWDKGIYSTSYTEKIMTAMEGYDNEI